MFEMRLGDIATAMQGTLHGDASQVCTRISTDSRDIRPGDVFIAIRGETFDGHDFAHKALELGAVAVVVETGRVDITGMSVIEVDDGVLAFGRIAAAWRNRFDLPLIAVTGSNGKTSVKEMIAAILRSTYGDAAVLATVGNLNNHMGVPQMLLRLSKAHKVAVLEMGMNHFGEIRHLTTMGRPTVALINNAGAGHLEFLGSIEGVARAKGEIFEGLDARGTAIWNGDDDFATYWQSLNTGRHYMRFGLTAGDVHASDVSGDAFSSSFTLHLAGQQARATVAVPGVHMVRNALAAAAACSAIGLTLEQIVAGLVAFTGVKGRLQKKQAANGAVVIDDTYNANPASMKAAADVLANIAGHRVLVLGDMGEVGEAGPARHEEICAYARSLGIERLLVTGTAMNAAIHVAGEMGQGFADHPQLIAALKNSITPDSTVLVKGSRFMKMERVIDALIESESTQGKGN
ncbi:UDP-N-acetylmuramoyl-tripeptide--D-alanyl-D-alanine ligase [Burkholderiaceae bacterium DAT-1]|nr:UDP-N-acetylmuramoyl-tripeptide--D-alanyl-D-alanine ligase [Burkholderiaceae bacterium DAT-1]